MYLRRVLGCHGRRRSAHLLLLLAPVVCLWAAVSYTSRSLIGSVFHSTTVGRSNGGGDSVYLAGPIATAVTLALGSCAGCAVAATAILAALLRLRCCDTERSWHRTIYHWLAMGIAGTAETDCCSFGGSRRDNDAGFTRRSLAALGPLPKLLLLAFCHAAAMLCELVTLAAMQNCRDCSIIISVEPLLAATLTAVLADIGTDSAVAAAGEPLPSAALLGLSLASSGVAALLSRDERWVWPGSSSSGNVGLILIGTATATRLARNFLLKTAYSRFENAALAPVASGSDSPAPAARLSLIAAMNAAALLCMLPVAMTLGALEDEQWHFVGFGQGAIPAATLLYAFGSMLSMLVVLPAMTLVEHTVARLTKNVIVATAFAAALSGKTLGWGEAASFALVAVGILVFGSGSDYRERGSAGTTSNKYLRTPQCILAAICFAALLFNQAADNRPAVIEAARSLNLDPCEVAGFPLAATASTLATSPAITQHAPQPPEHPSSSPLPPAAEFVETFRLHPVAHHYDDVEQSLSTHHVTSPLPSLPDILADEAPTVARLSNELSSVDALVNEACRLLDALLGHLLTGSRRAVLVNVFSWPNKGDHLITVAELRLLEKLNVTVVHACSFPAANCSFESVPLGSDLVILLQGGGYSGHPHHQAAFDNVVRSFPDQRIILLPNSLCYPTSPCTGQALTAFARSLTMHGDFHVLLRDSYSYETARREVDNVVNDNQISSGPRLYLSPDVAWAVESLVVNMAPVYDIVWLKRDDWESVGGDPMPPIPGGLRVQIIDWVDSWMGQWASSYWEHLQLRAMSGVAFLSRGRVIVSDRLHAHIMSQLMRKPNVLINSKTQKQGHYYTTWERNVETSRLAGNNSEALAMAIELLLHHGGPVTVPLVNPV